MSNYHQSGGGWLLTGQPRLGIFLLMVLMGLAACAGTPGPTDRPGAVERPMPKNYNLRMPDGPGPFPAVVVLHGCSGIVEREHEWAKRFVDWGYGALIVDSFTPRAVQEVCSSGSRVTTAERAMDAAKAAAFLRGQPRIRPDRLGVIGFSHGGATVLEAVQGGDPAPAFQAAVAFYPKCTLSLNHVDIPLLILIGEKDDWTPAKMCQEMMPTLTRPGLVDLQVYPGAYHTFDYQRPARKSGQHHLEYNAAAAADALSRTKAFFDRNLNF